MSLEGMNPLLEINPETCIVIVGPLVSRSCLPVVPDSLKLTHKSLMVAGTQMVRATDERGRLEELFQVDFDAASAELCTLLKRQGDLERWMSSCCCSGVHQSGMRITTASPTVTTPPILQLLLKIQNEGCRLVYTHYDNTLDTVAGMIPILPTNGHHLDQWITGHLKGFLHIHGHYSDTDSLILHSTTYDNLSSSRLTCFEQLRDLFRRRTLLFIGHNPAHLNPLLVKMVNTLLLDIDETIIRNPPLFISSTTEPLPSCFLHLPIREEEEECLEGLVVCGPESSFVIGRTPDKQVDKEIVRSQAILIFSEKQSFRKLGDIIYQLNQSGEIYVRRDALTVLFGNKIMYGNILTYGGSGLHRIWQLAVPVGSVLRNKGLVALGLQNSVMIWINKKPVHLGPITEVNTFHSLWNNSAAIMKSQPQTTAPAQALPLTSLSPITSTGEPLDINLAHHSLLTTPTCVPHPLSFRPLFPIMSSPFFPIGSLVSPVNVPSSVRPMLTPTGNLPTSNLYQIYNLPRPGLQPHSRSASESSSLGGVSLGDTRMESGGILDVDTSRSSLSECEGSSNGSNPCPMGLRADSPVQLQQIIEENCQEHELQIETSFNVSYKHALISTTTNNTRPSVGISTLDRPSVLQVAPPRQLPGANRGASPPTLPIKSVTQVPSPLTPRPAALPLVPLSPSVVPIATPTLQYPFTPTMSPYSFLPSIIQSDSLSRPQYYIKLLPSNTISSVPPIVQFMQTTPTATPQAITTTSLPFPLTPNMLPFLSATASNPQVLETTKHSTTSNSSTANTSGETIEEDDDDADKEAAMEGSDVSMHLWEFILHLLLTPNHGNIIQWTGENYEFSIIDPHALTLTWAQVTNSQDLNFNSLLGTLRSYSGLGILEQVEGKKLTYAFVMDIQKYMGIYGHKIVNLTTASVST